MNFHNMISSSVTYIWFVSDQLQIDGILRVLRFPLPIQLTDGI